MLKNHDRTDVYAAINIMVKAMNTDDWRECHHLLQLSEHTISRIASELYRQKMESGEHH